MWKKKSARGLWFDDLGDDFNWQKEVEFGLLCFCLVCFLAAGKWNRYNATSNHRVFFSFIILKKFWQVDSTVNSIKFQKGLGKTRKSLHLMLRGKSTMRISGSPDREIYYESSMDPRHEGNLSLLNKDLRIVWRNKWIPWMNEYQLCFVNDFEGNCTLISFYATKWY